MIILAYVVLGIGALVGAYLVYMLIVAITPGFSVPAQPLDRPDSRGNQQSGPPPAPKTDVCFEVEGTSLSAWLFLPDEFSPPVPCIVMAHGLGGTMDAGLEGYASRFRGAGFAVLAFDYRHFAGSGGEPRQLVWIPHQQEDWSGAVKFARGLDEIDSDRIALWGTSLSGGHVLVTAARDHKIACVSAQCPLLDGDAGGLDLIRSIGVGYALRMTFGHALRDMVRSWLRLSPHKIPLVGKPGTVAAMADAEAWEAFGQLMPDGFVNEVCARILIRMDKYHPINHVSEIQCPVLLQACDHDISLPRRVVDEAEAQLGSLAEVIHYPIGHFDIYLGENFEAAVEAQVAFFTTHL